VDAQEQLSQAGLKKGDVVSIHAVLSLLSRVAKTNRPYLAVAAITLIATAACGPATGADLPTLTPQALRLSRIVEPSPTPEPSPILAPSPTPAPPPRGRQLAFLQAGDVWLVAVPDGEPEQLTHSGEVVSFAWAPDGERIAAFDGELLCIGQPEGKTVEGCVEVGTNANQSTVQRQLVWSPDQKSILIWNTENPWDAEAVGWYVVSLGETGAVLPAVLSIDDPVMWGADVSGENESGGVTGEPLFLPDGTLLGTVTHSRVCGSGGCKYALFEFDPQARRFSPSTLTTSSDLGEDLELSANGRVVANLATFHSGCETYTTRVQALDLGTGEQRSFDFEQEAFNELALSPDGRQAVVARGPGCSSETNRMWAVECGLAEFFEVYAMDLWDLGSGQRTPLVPGVGPQWALDGSAVTFRSCLAQTPDGRWSATPSGPPWIFVVEPMADDASIVPVAQGSDPAWRPLEGQ